MQFNNEPSLIYTKFYIKYNAIINIPTKSNITRRTVKKVKPTPWPA